MIVFLHLKPSLCVSWNCFSIFQITGWVPLHEAAWKGHTDCAIALLNWDAPAMPRSAIKLVRLKHQKQIWWSFSTQFVNFVQTRTPKSETPADLARANGQNEMAVLLDTWYTFISFMSIRILLVSKLDCLLKPTAIFWTDLIWMCWKIIIQGLSTCPSLLRSVGFTRVLIVWQPFTCWAITVRTTAPSLCASPRRRRTSSSWACAATRSTSTSRSRRGASTIVLIR